MLTHIHTHYTYTLIYHALFTQYIYTHILHYTILYYPSTGVLQVMGDVVEDVIGKLNHLITNTVIILYD